MRGQGNERRFPSRIRRNNNNPLKNLHPNYGKSETEEIEENQEECAGMSRIDHGPLQQYARRRLRHGRESPLLGYLRIFLIQVSKRSDSVCRPDHCRKRLYEGEDHAWDVKSDRVYQRDLILKRTGGPLSDRCRIRYPLHIRCHPNASQRLQEEESEKTLIYYQT